LDTNQHSSVWANANYYGRGVSRDIFEVKKWFSLSAEGNNPHARYYLGMCYLQGEGTAKDPAEAVRWLKKASKSHLPDVQYQLGLCFQQGIISLRQSPSSEPYSLSHTVQWLSPLQLSCSTRILYSILPASGKRQSRFCRRNSRRLSLLSASLITSYKHLLQQTLLQLFPEFQFLFRCRNRFVEIGKNVCDKALLFKRRHF